MRWVEAMQLGPGVGSGEAPVDGCASPVPGSLPGLALAGERVGAPEAPAQTLALQCTELDLGHVEPARMLGRVVELQLLREAPCFVWAERLVERGRAVGAEVVQHQPDHVRL